MTIEGENLTSGDKNRRIASRLSIGELKANPLSQLPRTAQAA
ncbi:MAG: hypothetical protein WKF84_09165 [Pyrinomonadaceae bacterium]